MLKSVSLSDETADEIKETLKRHGVPATIERHKETWDNGHGPITDRYSYVIAAGPIPERARIKIKVTMRPLAPYFAAID